MQQQRSLAKRERQQTRPNPLQGPVNQLNSFARRFYNKTFIFQPVVDLGALVDDSESGVRPSRAYLAQPAVHVG